MTVVIPVRDGRATLPATLAALRAQGRGTPSFEIVVVDNGSSDGTLEWLRDQGDITLVTESTPGPAAARNAGLAVARGRWVAFTDADCVPEVGWLRALLEATRHAGVRIVAGEILSTEPRTAVQCWMAERRILDPRSPLAHPFRPFVQTANALYRRDDLVRVGGFDPALRSAEDADLSWRVHDATGCGVHFCPAAVVRHDHRADVAGLFRQAATSIAGAQRLSRKWGARVPGAGPGRLVWEARQTLTAAVGALRTVLPGKRRQRFNWLDVVFRAGRTLGVARVLVGAGRRSAP
jgi:glycosyltransferase involved in cell wall biosynthesis